MPQTRLNGAGQRLTLIVACATWAFCGQRGQAAMKPQVIDTRFPTDDIVIASVVVGPLSSGDTTGAIQAAIDEAAEAGGAVVFLPAGRYRLEGSLTVKEGVTLRGDWAPPTEGAADQGTLLMPVAGRGEAGGTPALILERGSGLREVTIWYPDQKPDDIVPYPWTIKTSPAVAGDNYTVLNCTLVNPYQGIKIGPEWNELHTIRNVYGTPLQTGIWLDTTTDIGRVVDVHFGPQWWEESGLPDAPAEDQGRIARPLSYMPSVDPRRTLRGFLHVEGTALDMGRSDWEYLWGLDIFGYSTGMMIRKGERGTANAVMFGSHFAKCGKALRLSDLNGVGLSATGCSFEGSRCAVLTDPSFKTVAQFNSCAFKDSVGVERRGGGIRSVSDQSCAPVETVVRSGERALRVAGNADDADYSYVHFAAFEGKWGIAPDSVLSYWIRPANERGRCVGIDLRFTDGSTLRDSGGKTSDGQGLHAGNGRGTIGEWAQIVIPVGRFASGKAVATIMFAYDSRGGGGPFEAFIDDVKLESALLANAWAVGIEPNGGAVAAGAAVTLTPPDGVCAVHARFYKPNRRLAALRRADSPERRRRLRDSLCCRVGRRQAQSARVRTAVCSWPVVHRTDRTDPTDQTDPWLRRST